MLFVIDVGNTNIVLGIYDGSRLLKDWRIRTEPNTTEDEFGVLATSLFAGSGVDTKQIEKTVISCVVPPMVTILDAFCRKYLRHPPLWVSADTVKIMPIDYSSPAEVGADRIVNAVAAFHKYRTGLIIIDFGTATTFDVVSEKGEYLGGAISPGIMIAAEALYSHASKLPRVEIFTPPPNSHREKHQREYSIGYYFRICRDGGRYRQADQKRNAIRCEGDRNRRTGPSHAGRVRNHRKRGTDTDIGGVEDFE